MDYNKMFREKFISDALSGRNSHYSDASHYYDLSKGEYKMNKETFEYKASKKLVEKMCEEIGSSNVAEIVLNFPEIKKYIFDEISSNIDISYIFGSKKVIEFVRKHYAVNNVFLNDEIKQYVAEYFMPEEIFPADEIILSALRNDNAREFIKIYIWLVQTLFLRS